MRQEMKNAGSNLNPKFVETLREIESSSRGIASDKKEKKTPFSQREVLSSNEKGLKRPNCEKANREVRRDISEKIVKPVDVTEDESLILANLAHCFTAALAHTTRMRMLYYCRTPSSFTNVMITLKLNPASFKYHMSLLQKSGLIEKQQQKEGITYQTTELGKVMLEVIDSIKSAIESPQKACT